MDGETVEAVSDFIFLGSRVTADGDCSHEIKRYLLLGRKVMTNVDSILKSRDITWPTNICLVKAMVFPVSHVWMWELDCEESWGGQSTGVSALASVLSMNNRDWFLLWWTSWLSLQSKEFSSVFSISQFKNISSSAVSFLCSPTLTSTHDQWKNHRLD